MRKLWIKWTVVGLTAMGVLAGCGSPPPTRLDVLYEGLSEVLPKPDSRTLAGRRILVDPGHGGYFRGTTGTDNLAESHVNLGVSLYLWGLLQEAGADVFLTRTIDRDFLSLSDSTVAFDLQARVDMADSLQPDIFISIHHNAQPQRDPEFNRVETYYKAGDPSSLDLAFSIHRHLMRNLGIKVGEVRQGNYFVLRNVDIPAILGESSYLTHPAVEEKLALSRAQRLEAEAYFLGVVDYFDRGIPLIVLTSPTDSVGAIDSVQTAPPLLTFALADDGGLGVDPDGIDFRVNGQVTTPTFRDEADGNGGSSLTYAFPWDAPNGVYSVALTVRNILGNTSAPHRIEFALNMPTHVAVFAAPNHIPAAGQGALSGKARLLDKRGLPVIDGTVVTVEISTTAEPFVTTVSDGAAEYPIPVSGDTEDLTVTLRSDGRTFTHTISRRNDGESVGPTLTLLNGMDGSPVRRAHIGDNALRGSVDGIFYPPAGGQVLRVPGFMPVQLDTIKTDTLNLQPWNGGVLLGKRFVLDPEGGRASVAGAGSLGLSASHVNLRVARYLAGFLEASGAVVRLTRTNEEVPTPEDIARTTNRFLADRYIEIRHRPEPPESSLVIRTYHFPGSRTGRRMADDVGNAMSTETGYPARAAQSQVTYPLQQTACPAIIVEAPSIANVGEEMRLDQSYYLRLQAYAVFTGVLNHFAAPDSASLTVQIDHPVAEGWLVTVDDTWTLLTGPTGDVKFSHLPHGEHRISARRHDVRNSTTVRLDLVKTTLTLTP